MQTPVSLFPGAVLMILILAIIVTLPVTFFLISRYNRALIKGMGYVSQLFKTHPETTEVKEKALSFTPEFQMVDVSQLPDNTSPTYLKLKETLGYHWFTYGAMCLVFAAINAWCLLQGEDSINIWQFSLPTLSMFFPFLPVSLMLLANGFKQQLIIIAILMFVFITGTYIIWAKSAEEGTTFISMLSPFLFNIIPILIIAILRIEKIKAVGMFIYSFFIICFSGPAFLIYFFASKPEILETAGYAFIDMGLPSYVILFLWIILSLGAASIVGWVLINQIKKLYINKRINDIQTNADSIMLLFNITFSIIIIFSSPTYALVSLLAFPAYKITGYLLFYFLRKRKIKEVSPRLLLLRVFALGDDSRNLFERVLKHWRYAGSIQMITGPDLATTTIEPHEVISFVSGNLKKSFCEDEASIKKNISNADTLPDLDGTHRVNEFFCRDNNWKEVLAKLVQHSDVVLMDLRSFSDRFKGCKYEIEALVNLISLDKLIFVTDKNTDINFTKNVFTHAFQMADNTSPNILNPKPVQLYNIDTRNDKNVFRLLNLLCSKIE